jgi:tRNA(fMet)-specific endonuclease VapC
MTDVLLDTNIVIKIIQARNPALQERIGAALNAGAKINISAITVLELQVGVMRNANVETAARKRDLFMSLVENILDFDEHDARQAAAIRVSTMQTGQTIGAYDVLIGAQALRRNMRLITNNVREFSRIPNLIWEDWTQN